MWWFRDRKHLKYQQLIAHLPPYSTDHKYKKRFHGGGQNSSLTTFSPKCYRRLFAKIVLLVGLVILFIGVQAGLFAYDNHLDGLLLHSVLPLFFSATYPVAFWEPLDIEAANPIPKIIHQTYKDENLPSKWSHVPLSYKNTMPDYEYMFWSDKKIQEFLEQNYPWFLPTFESYEYHIQRVDSIRYFILYHYGGIYVDMDVGAKIRLDDVLKGHDVIIPITPDLGVTNAFMTSSKHSDFFQYVIHHLEERNNLRYLGVKTRHWVIIGSTGPAFLHWCMEHYTNKKNLSVVEPHIWGKCGLCESCRDLSDAWFTHVPAGGSSWWSISSSIVTTVWCNFWISSTIAFPGVCFTFYYLYVYVDKGNEIEKEKVEGESIQTDVEENIRLITDDGLANTSTFPIPHSQSIHRVRSAAALSLPEYSSHGRGMSRVRSFIK